MFSNWQNYRQQIHIFGNKYKLKFLCLQENSSKNLKVCDIVTLISTMFKICVSEANIKL